MRYKLFFILFLAQTLMLTAINVAECRCHLEQVAENNPAVLDLFDKSTAQFQELPEFETLLEAIVFSSTKHRGQCRKDAQKTPYIIHPIGVAYTLWNEGSVRDLDVLIAALLHDTLEDTDATPSEIEAKFGPKVLCIIQEITNDPHLSREENKQRQVDHAIHLSHSAKLVKLADRLYNIRDLRVPPPTWSQEQVDTYYLWGSKLLMALRGTNPALESALQHELRGKVTPL